MPQLRKNKKGKVLMVARAFPPFLPVGHSIRVIKFIKYLPALGWEPVVLTVSDGTEYETLPKVGSEVLLSQIPFRPVIHRTAPGEPTLNYLQKEQEFGRKNRLAGFFVKLAGGARRWIFRNLFIPDRTLTWLPSAVTRGKQVVKEDVIDVIFVTCPPHAATLIGALLKIFTRKPLILDFRDDWIDTPWHVSKPLLVRWMDRTLEKWVVSVADRVILVTEWSRQAFQDRYPKEPKDKFKLITNGCDLGDFEQLQAKPPAFRNSKFTILHAGSLNVSKIWGRSPEGLFKAIQNILQGQPELQETLDFVFAGDLPADFRELADAMGLSNVIRGVGHVPHDEILDLTRSASLLLAINYEGWATLIPGKIYEYWAVGGAPILLLSCPGAATNFVEQHQLGVSAEPYDVAGIERAILDVYQRWKTGSPMTIDPAGIEVFDRKALTAQLAQILSSLLPNQLESADPALVHS